ncbi:MAG TPA: hypothetical protein VFW96_10215 [Thermomicrobiales bacterium]|nr:hypothetical protein [Thermomicrobiales bacterium]
MSVLRQVQERLGAVEQALADQPRLAAEVRAVRQLLAAPARQWVGTVEAQRLLEVKSVNTVKAWARAGLLRSRRLPNGRLQVHLDDVLREREAGRALAAFPDDAPVTDEERRAAPSPEVQAVLDDLVRHLEPRLTRLTAPERR